MMNPDPICPTCGLTVHSGSPLGLCPRCCFLGQGLDPIPSAQTLDIPGFEIIHLLGEGAFGRVYECLQLNPSPRRIALKLMKGDTLGTAMRARFLEEVAILAELSHPHIARLLGSGHLPDATPYYLMELIDGIPLDHWLQTNPQPSQRLTALIQITSAVAYAHQNGIVHRDLKPANVLIENHPDQPIHSKIIDFGIARALSGPTSWGRAVSQIGQRIGTPLYMSPEQLAGSTTIDTRSDIFTLGLLIYEVALGKPVLAPAVHHDASWEDNLTSLRQFIFPPLPNRELSWIARKACALDPADRYPSARDLANDLTALHQGHAVRAGDPYWQYRLWKMARAHKAWITLILIALLTLLTLASAGWWVSHQERLARQRISQSMELEQAARSRAELAETAVRRESSDTELLAATRAMDSGNYEESRTKLQHALTLWPENAPARYALNFINATIPTAQPTNTLTIDLPWNPLAIAPSPAGFLLSDHQKTLLLLPDGTLTPATTTFPDPIPTQWTHPTNHLHITNLPTGILTFTDPDTGSPALNPINYGAGRELATYSPHHQLVLITGTNQKARLLDVSSMARAYQSITLDNEPAWFSFERNTSHLWIFDSKSRVRKWAADSPTPGFSLPTFTFSRNLSIWQLGEGHTRGMPPGTTGFKTLTQLSARKLSGKLKNITSVAQARETDNSLIGGDDTEISVGFQIGGQFFQKITGATGIPHLLALDSQATIGAQINNDNLLQIIDPQNLLVTHSIPLQRPASSLAILDGAQDLIIAHQDGTLSILDLPTLTFRHRHLPLLGTPAKNVQIRALPRTREFLSRLDGDTLIRRHSALTATESGPPLRHQIGVHWFCASNDGQFLFSIDQRHPSPGTLRIWSLRTGREIVPGLRHPAPILWATVLNDGKRIATSDTTNTLRRWILSEN